MSDKIKNFYNIYLLKFVKSYISILFIFIIAFLFRFFLVESNPRIQIDEPASFTASTPSVVSKTNDFYKIDCCLFNIEKSRNYTGLELNNLLFKPDPSIDSVLKDLKIIRLQSFDRQHPNLYYSILRIWNNFLGDFDKDRYLKHARHLNLIFFCLSFYFMYKLLALINKDKHFINLALIFAFFNVATLYLASLAREYALQETFLILSTYCALLLYKKLKLRENISFKTLLVISTVFALLLLTGYFSIIYFVLLLIPLFIYSVSYDSNKFIVFVLIIFTLFFTYILCPNYFHFRTNSQHYSAVFLTLSLGNFLNGIFNLKIAYSYMLKYLLYPSFLFCIVITYFLSKLKLVSLQNSFIKKQEKTIIVFLILLVAFWIYCVLFLAPYKILRYFASAIPLFSLILVLLISRIRTSLKYMLATIYVLITLYVFITQSWYDSDRLSIKVSLESLRLPLVVVNPRWDFIYYTFLKLDKNDTVRFEDSDFLESRSLDGIYILMTRNKTDLSFKKGYIGKSWDSEFYLVHKSNN